MIAKPLTKFVKDIVLSLQVTPYTLDVFEKLNRTLFLT